MATIHTMERGQFYKSMTSYAGHRSWQDVYHVPSTAGTLYIKFTADVVAEFVLLSFKEKTVTSPVDPETGTPLHRDVRPLTLTYKGRSITFDMPGWYSEQPDQGIFDPDDMKVSDRALNRLKAGAEGLLEPEDIRRIRKRLRLTQTAAGELIGGGPRAFQKYETGDLLPSRAISSALRLLEHDPEGITVLQSPQAEVVTSTGHLPCL